MNFSHFCHFKGPDTILASHLVGLYCHKEIIGQSYGETLEIAEEMAARDALRNILGTAEHSQTPRHNQHTPLEDRGSLWDVIAAAIGIEYEDRSMNMIRSPRRRRTLSGLVLASLFSPLGWSSTLQADRLADALGIIPDEAVAWMVIPSLSALNADLGDMLDRANRPELAVAGRPIDVIISQFGIAAGFDERGSLAAWAASAGGGRQCRVTALLLYS